jgi:predicted LPLAT superfamily acyltransferase
MKPPHDSEPNAASAHWTQIKEKAAGYWHLKMLLILFRILPVVILHIMAFPVGFFYFLFSKNARAESRRFLNRAARFAAKAETAKMCSSPLGPFRHIVSFSLNLVEKLETWGGKFPYKHLNYNDDDVRELIEGLENGKGAFLITSHLGNVELLRGLARYNRTELSKIVPVTAIMDVEVSSNFTRMIKELNLQSSFDVINANDVGPQTAIIMEEKLKAGELLASSGDRSRTAGGEKNLLVPFLGEEALFAQGIFYCAVLLNAPVYFVFALRRKDLSIRPIYDMHVHKYCPPAEFVSSKISGRKERQRIVSDMLISFAAHLEKYCKEKPFQWYNFYDFWAK